MPHGMVELPHGMVETPHGTDFSFNPCMWLQISIYDTIDKEANYSSKVRRLGEYHPDMAATKDQEGQDIGDPLYGNEGGVDELVCMSCHSTCAHVGPLGLSMLHSLCCMLTVLDSDEGVNKLL